jgi:hypothetical protein
MCACRPRDLAVPFDEGFDVPAGNEAVREAPRYSEDTRPLPPDDVMRKRTTRLIRSAPQIANCFPDRGIRRS